jgi:hypothetical protein
MVNMAVVDEHLSAAVCWEVEDWVENRIPRRKERRGARRDDIVSENRVRRIFKSENGGSFHGSLRKDGKASD